MDKYELISSKTVHAGRFDVVCESFQVNGKTHPFSYVKMKNCAAALCMEGDSVILLKQYRYILDSWEWEIPAGGVEDGEEPKDTILKEIEEETGYSVDNLTYLGWYHLSVGSTTEKVFLYYASCSERKDQNLEALEKIEVHKVPVAECERMVDDNEIHQCMGVAAWNMYKSNIKKKRD